MGRMATKARRARLAIYEGHADLYDRVYSFKDYGHEVRQLRRILRLHGIRPGARLLDVGSGTAEHLVHLAPHYEVVGLDASIEMLRVARSKLPGVRFYRGRMETFDLGRRFDIITCLFSGIGYVRTLGALRATVRRMSAHLAQGGLLVVEPWLEPSAFESGHSHLLTVDEPDLKIARLSFGSREGRTSVIEMRYLVSDPHGIRSFHERHEMGLFTRSQMIRAFEAAGLRAEHRSSGLSGRGIYLARAAPVTGRSVAAHRTRR